MAPHSYKSDYPAGTGAGVKEGIQDFLETFYEISDTPDVHDLYADQFLPDATLVMAGTKKVGREEIFDFRKGMWALVASRLHTPIKVFPFGEDSDEVMLYGTVAYVLKDGRKAKVEWSARANLVKDGEKWKFGFYQVYLDTAAMQNAK